MPLLGAQMVVHVSKPPPRPTATSLRPTWSHDGPTWSQRLPPGPSTDWVGDGRSDPQPGTVPLGIVDQPRGLASEIFIDRMQCVQQLARRHTLRALGVLAFEHTHDPADALDAALGILRLPVPNASAQTLNPGDDHRLRRRPSRVVGRQI
jgi:hypothetical protein